MDLGRRVGVAKGFEDGGLERDNGGGSIIGAEVSECSYAPLVTILGI
jgi:hypothetical protein